jgi:hypothetical protein
MPKRKKITPSEAFLEASIFGLFILADELFNEGKTVKPLLDMMKKRIEEIKNDETQR